MRSRKARLRAAGFDGAVVLRPHPGYTRVDTILRVELPIDSIERDALLWSGVTESFEPQSPCEAVTDIAGAVVNVLEREGLLVRSEP